MPRGRQCGFLVVDPFPEQLNTIELAGIALTWLSGLLDCLERAA